MPTIYQELQATAKLTSLTDPPPVDAEDQEHLSWLAQAVAMTTKEQFEVMSEPAQEWFDAAADSLNTGNPIPVPPGFGEPEAPPVKPKAIIGRPRASGLNGPTPTPVPPAPPAMTVSAAPEEPEPEPPAPPVSDPHPLSQPPQPMQPPPAAEPPAPPQQAAAPDAGDPYEDAGVGDTKPTKKARGGRAPAEGEVSVTQRIREYVIERQDITVDEIINRLKTERQPDMSGKRKATVVTLRSDTLRTLSLAKAVGWQPPQHQ